MALRDELSGAALTMSPDFEPPDDQFLVAIADSYVTGRGQRSGFASGLAGLFATITHQGEVRNDTCHEDCCSAVLWKSFGSHPRGWYRFDVCFDGENVRAVRAEWMPPPSK